MAQQKTAPVQQQLTATDERGPFDPSRYLTKIGGSDYLEVKWRLVWLREVHPDALIRTELVHHDERQAIFRAEVTIPGGGSATGWGSESPGDFRDFLEKAETKALGRALAALGYGTQFCPDFDFGASENRVVDAPIDFASTRGRRRAAGLQGEQPVIASMAQPATQRQVNYLQGVAREAGLDAARLDEIATQRFGRVTNELDRRETSQLIEIVQSMRGSADLAS